MRTKKDFYQIACDHCSSSIIIHVDEGVEPYNREDLGGYRLYPRRSDRNHEFHLCPACQRLEPNFKVIPGGKKRS